ncbi:T9SS type A sorting domain-containing protein [Wenyingzhuangia sp. chi5]|uniref:T9SS type A sorting domain-containing protein n=1 Tax=Wenyingzhuangia gilva TaxID=3057677 RepID=A0ABT8VQI2_9FLAO|nr:T9SS type A sorting domain-containing protein [Wenyingzhuangia sp. chi5]MDO3694229.1 T9SS type A sorting domain-containing protein [Wenyingzhuangia sp. chi5]
MKKRLLILSLIASIYNTNGQNKIWDFGGDATYTSAAQIAMWPVAAYNAAEGTTVVKDGLTLVGDNSGDKFGQIENSGGKTWDAGTPDEYTAINRFKFNGGSDPVDFMPSISYLSFPVTGPVDVKVWFRSGSSSANRTLYISDGTSLINSFDAIVDNTDPETIIGNYTGTGGTIYIYTSNSFNLYKIEVKESNLGIRLNEAIKTNVKAMGNKVYVSEVDTDTEISIYSITGALIKKIQTNKDVNFMMKSGLWIVKVKTDKGIKSLKLATE